MNTSPQAASGRQPSPAALRKARQRAESKAEGRRSVEIDVGAEVHGLLADLAAMTGGTLKEQAEFLVKGAIRPYLAETKRLHSEARALADRLVAILPFAGSLRQPGDYVVVKGVTYRFEDYEPAAKALGVIQEKLARRGWSRARVRAFCGLP
jgi:hypothetical protein